MLDFSGGRTKDETLNGWVLAEYAGKSRALVQILALSLTDSGVLGLLLTFPV